MAGNEAKELARQRQENLRSQTRLVQARRKDILDTEQTYCNHMKPMLHGTALVALNIKEGVTSFLCQFCQKVWDQDSVPNHLKPDKTFIGNGFLDGPGKDVVINGLALEQAKKAEALREERIRLEYFLLRNAIEAEDLVQNLIPLEVK